MTKDPILDELRATRERLLAESGGTLDGLVDRLQAEERRSGRPRFPSQRTVRSPNSADVAEEGGENRPDSPDGC